MATQSRTIEGVRGDKLSFVVSLMLDGSPFVWNEWTVTSQLRRSANSPDVLATFTIVSDADDLSPGEARFSLDTVPESGVWDVQFVNLTTQDNATWPGPGEDRHHLVATADVTRPVVAP